uniref:PDZK1-interacting protein 1 n=1 Tax=Loxodonta africana TaxID=9785 RepID=G3UIB6_LOXAF
RSLSLLCTCSAPCDLPAAAHPLPSPGLGNLEPWMQGLIAVAVFLVLVAIAFAVNHFWCQEEPPGPEWALWCPFTASFGVMVGVGRRGPLSSSFRSNERENAYENTPEEEGKVQSTPM